VSVTESGKLYILIYFTYFNEFNFYQHNNISNMHGNTLDLLFSTLRCIHMFSTHNPLLPYDLFHPPLVFSLPVSVKTTLKITKQTKFNFKWANFSVINEYLNNIDWDMELKNLDDAVNFVYYYFNHIIDSCIPFFTIFYPTWFSKELIFY